MAMSTISSEIVKPMPDSAAPPVTRPMVSPGASLPSPLRWAAALARVMPSSLPITRPATIPQVRRDRAAAPRVAASSTTPALASAKIGSTTNEVNGA